MSLQDDPRLTAYALGELDAAEAAELEALLANDPAAQAEVDAIRSMAALLESELAEEAAPVADEALRADVLEGPGNSRGWMLWAAGVAALAASIGLVVVSKDPEPAPPVDRDDRFMKVITEQPQAKRSNQPVLAPAYPVAPASRAVAPAPVAPASNAPMAPSSMAPPRRIQPPARWDGDGGPASVGSRAPTVPRTARSQAELDALIDGINTEHYRPQAKPSLPQRVAAPMTAPARVNGLTAQVRDPNTAMRDARLVGEKRAGAGKLKPQTSGLINTALVDNLRADPVGRDQFIAPPENPFTQPTLEPLSTFSIDVDTASYSMVRSQLTRGRRPQRGAVRIEEMLNYFDYDYAPPVDGQPFATHVEVAAAPWAPQHRLVRVGLKGKMIDRPRANLVFLLDVSGSMSARNKLPLLKDAMATLVDNLHPEDRVAIVVYAGASGLVLDSTPAKDKRAILGALDRLKSGGGTNGGAGIKQAYWIAAQNFIQGGVNRVIIGTDGDFNVGTTSRHALVEMVEQRAQGGIALTVLGFGMGQSSGGYNDATLEQLADKGDGNYAFIDTADEARKVLVDQLDGTLVTIAKDVKIQVEFNPAQVAAYRLIGYENRKLAAQDFNDDTKDAGEIGAGHTVTALYEVIPTGVAGGRAVDPLKYQPRKPLKPISREMLTLKLRYKAPQGGKSRLISGAVIDDGAAFTDASADLRFAASVAAFGMLLRGSPHAGNATLDSVLAWASDAIGKDEWRYRQGFLDLVRKARGRY